jgi:hypothetical protein
LFYKEENFGDSFFRLNFVQKFGSFYG